MILKDKLMAKKRRCGKCKRLVNHNSRTCKKKTTKKKAKKKTIKKRAKKKTIKKKAKKKKKTLAKKRRCGKCKKLARHNSRTCKKKATRKKTKKKTTRKKKKTTRKKAAKKGKKKNGATTHKKSLAMWKSLTKKKLGGHIGVTEKGNPSLKKWGIGMSKNGLKVCTFWGKIWDWAVVKHQCKTFGSKAAAKAEYNRLVNTKSKTYALRKSRRRRRIR
jgi:hypothetical protein